MTEEQIQVIAGIVKASAYYSFMAIAAYFGLKYGLKENAIKLQQHIEEDHKAFEQVTLIQGQVTNKMDTAIDLLQQHTVALTQQAERSTGVRERQERIEAKVGSIDEKLTDLRVYVAKSQ